MQSEVLFNVRSNSGKICPPNFWYSQQSVLSFAVPNPGWRERRWVLFCKKQFMVILREGILSDRGKQVSRETSTSTEARALNTSSISVHQQRGDTDSSSTHALPVGQFHHLDFSTWITFPGCYSSAWNGPVVMSLVSFSFSLDVLQSPETACGFSRLPFQGFNDH